MDGVGDGDRIEVEEIRFETMGFGVCGLLKLMWVMGHIWPAESMGVNR